MDIFETLIKVVQEEGFKIGFKEGFEEGFEEGWKESIKIGKKQFGKNMLSNTDFIIAKKAALANITDDYIEKVRTSGKKKAKSRL
ncbi:MAG: hypothetical protein KF862_24735 [Chitinophagaceae bacterium]|nr:hypothetical protein [Chitinophagaceae bacterium]